MSRVWVSNRYVVFAGSQETQIDTRKQTTTCSGLETHDHHIWYQSFFQLSIFRAIVSERENLAALTFISFEFLVLSFEFSDIAHPAAGAGPAAAHRDGDREQRQSSATTGKGRKGEGGSSIRNSEFGIASHHHTIAIQRRGAEARRQRLIAASQSSRAVGLQVRSRTHGGF